jgi:hypothetical protein
MFNPRDVLRARDNSGSNSHALMFRRIQKSGHGQWNDEHLFEGLTEASRVCKDHTVRATHNPLAFDNGPQHAVQFASVLAPFADPLKTT